MLPSEQEELSYRDWCQLVAGLMPDTPLGRVVQVRAEKDRKVIEGFTPWEKHIRAEWQRFRTSRQERQWTEADKLRTAQYFERLFAGMFGGES